MKLSLYLAVIFLLIAPKFAAAQEVTGDVVSVDMNFAGTVWVRIQPTNATGTPLPSACSNGMELAGFAIPANTATNKNTIAVNGMYAAGLTALASNKQVTIRFVDNSVNTNLCQGPISTISVLN